MPVPYGIFCTYTESLSLLSIPLLVCLLESVVLFYAFICQPMETDRVFTHIIEVETKCNRGQPWPGFCAMTTSNNQKNRTSINHHRSPHLVFCSIAIATAGNCNGKGNIRINGARFSSIQSQVRELPVLSNIY